MTSKPSLKQEIMHHKGFEGLVLFTANDRAKYPYKAYFKKVLGRNAPGFIFAVP